MNLIKVRIGYFLIINEYWVIVPTFVLINYIIISMIIRLGKYVQTKNKKNTNKNTRKNKLLKRLDINNIRGGQEFINIQYKENPPIKELKYINKEKVQKIILNHYKNVIRQEYGKKVKGNIKTIIPTALHKIIKELKFLPIFLTTVHVHNSIQYLLENSPSTQNYNNQVIEQYTPGIIELVNLNFENESLYKIKIPSKSDEYILPSYIFKKYTYNEEIFKNQNDIHLDYENIINIFDYVLCEDLVILKDKHENLNKYEVQDHSVRGKKSKPKSTTVNFLDKFNDTYVSENETWDIDTNSIEPCAKTNSSGLIKLQNDE